MRPRALSKLVSGFFCSLMFAAFIHHDAVEKFSKGKELYLADEAHRFEQTVALNARTPLPAIFGAIFIFGMLFVVYELIAVFADRFMDTPAPDQPKAVYPGQSV